MLKRIRDARPTANVSNPTEPTRLQLASKHISGMETMKTQKQKEEGKNTLLINE
jgi:hypothetical protein